MENTVNEETQRYPIIDRIELNNFLIKIQKYSHEQHY
jgi:hypothetical protein